MPKHVASSASARANRYVREWIGYEPPFARDDWNGADADGAVFHDHASAVILAAPHGVNHYRRGAVKRADLRTGSLALLIAQHLNITTLVASAAKTPWHTWEDREDPFTARLKNLPSTTKFLLDMHGMSDDHGPDLCVGLGPMPGSLEDKVTQTLVESWSQYEVSINTPFAAKQPYTITAFSQRHLKIPAVQLEIAARHRDPENSPERAKELVIALMSAIAKVEQFLDTSEG